MKKIIFFTLFTISAIYLNAQTSLGIDYFMLGEFNAAKQFFQKHLNDSPAESYYYLGEIALLEGKADEAKSYYQKGLDANPEYYQNEVGLAQFLIKTDVKSAEKSFKDIIKKSKKDINIMLAVGRAYLDNGILDVAQEKVNDARKKDKKNPEVYVLEGDIILASKQIEKLGEAAGKYDMAIYFDPSYRISYVKGALAYENINTNLSIEKLETIIRLQPDYMIAYRNLGKIYVNTGFYKKAIEAYSTYFNGGGEVNTEDIERFARANYFTDQFDEARKLVNQGLQLNPQHFVLNRYKMYIDAKSKDPNGLKDAEKFFSIKGDNKNILMDYTMYADILKEAGLFDQAIEQYKIALSLDPEKTDLYKDMADVAKDQGDFGKAGSFYKKYVKTLTDETVEGRDYYQLGWYFYNAGTKILTDSTLVEKLMIDNQLIADVAKSNSSDANEINKDKSTFSKELSKYYLTESDDAFRILTDKVPEGYTGFLWRGRTNSKLDLTSELGLAKPYYEKVIGLLENKEDNKEANAKILVEAYSYLGYLYYLKDDKENTIQYWNKVLELDPNNRNAKMVLEAMEGTKK